MAKTKPKQDPAPVPVSESGEMSLAEIRNKMSLRYDPKVAPPDLQMMLGAATDAAGQRGDYGPDVWGPIWNERCVTHPNARGERLKTFNWKLAEGERGDCCMAEIPRPYAMHAVFIGWKETKKGSFFAKEYVRCLALKYELDGQGSSRKVPTNTPCPFCKVLGADRWRVVQIGGVIDMRKDQGPEPFIGPDGRVLDTPPRILILNNDAVQRAVYDGLFERHVRGKPRIGTVFHVSRGSGKNTASVGTNWIPDLDITVPEKEIQKIYAPINMNRAYPLLDGKSNNQFNTKEHKDIALHILERHISLCIKYADKMPGRFIGYDEHGAEDIGLDLKEIRARSSALIADNNETEDVPQRRGLRIMSVPDESSTGPSLRDLADKEQPTQNNAPEGETDVGKNDIINMDKDNLMAVANDFGIKFSTKMDVDELRLLILTSPRGFALTKEEAEGMLGLIHEEEEVGEASTETNEAKEEAEEAEEAPAVDIEALKERLLDKSTTKIAEVVAAAKEYGVTPVMNDKNQVIRAATVDAILKALNKRDPWNL